MSPEPLPPPHVAHRPLPPVAMAALPGILDLARSLPAAPVTPASPQGPLPFVVRRPLPRPRRPSVSSPAQAVSRALHCRLAGPSYFPAAPGLLLSTSPSPCVGPGLAVLCPMSRVLVRRLCSSTSFCPGALKSGVGAVELCWRRDVVDIWRTARQKEHKSCISIEQGNSSSWDQKMRDSFCSPFSSSCLSMLILPKSLDLNASRYKLFEDRLARALSSDL